MKQFFPTKALSIKWTILLYFLNHYFDTVEDMKDLSSKNFLRELKKRQYCLVVILI
jgi:hypothetical protein